MEKAGWGVRSSEGPEDPDDTFVDIVVSRALFLDWDERRKRAFDTVKLVCHLSTLQPISLKRSVMLPLKGPSVSINISRH